MEKSFGNPKDGQNPVAEGNKSLEKSFGSPKDGQRGLEKSLVCQSLLCACVSSVCVAYVCAVICLLPGVLTVMIDETRHQYFLLLHPPPLVDAVQLLSYFLIHLTYLDTCNAVCG